MSQHKMAVSLFDHTGYAMRPWAMAGYECLCFDIKNYVWKQQFYGESRIQFVHMDLNETDMVLKMLNYYKPRIVTMFPPCTDLAVSGAAHFERKRVVNPDFQKKAFDLATKNIPALLALDIPWMLENPISVLSTMWRKPNYYFNPFEYGGSYPKMMCIPSGPI